MRITCPHCGFAKEIAAEQIPTNVVRVTCPDCRQPFQLREEPSTDIDPAAEPGMVDTVALETERTNDQLLTEPESTEETASEDDSESAGNEPYSDEPPGGELVEPTEPACGEPAEPACGEFTEPASIGARYAALLIDAMLILIMVMTLRAGVSWLGNGIPFTSQIIFGVIFMLFALTLGFAYNTLFIGICGQTPGKMLLRIQVVAADYSAMTYRRAMLREVLGKTISLPLLLGYFMAMFNPRRLAAHDKIADTCVVKLITEATVD